MTATLVTLAKPDVPWSRPERPLLVIGKDILELLSSSMYVDPMAMYREYVQNSSDAIDLAKAAGVSECNGVVHIAVDSTNRTIVIRDDGIGLGTDDFSQRLMAIGGSKKRGTSARGFRGVGRLAGLAFAQEVIFRSRQPGERTVHELLWSGRDVRAMMRSNETRDLQDIVTKSIQIREVSASGWPDRFFEVELRGVIRHRDDRLLNQEAVFNYLAQVAPVPFHPEFQFGEQIVSLLQTHGVTVGSLDIEIEGFGRVYRPHRDHISVGKSTETAFQELTTFCTPGRDGGTAAVTWLLHSDYRGALPSGSLIEGWRFRVGDIQIGSNDLLLSLFPEPRFNSWCVGETHVLDLRILPNGRRDQFEQSAFYLDLINHLAPHAREIAQRCRASSVRRNLIRKIESGLAECEKRMRILAKRGVSDAVASRLSVQTSQELEQIGRMVTRSAVPREQQTEYQKKTSRMKQRLLRLKDRTGQRSALDAFTPAQREIISEVFRSIYRADPDLERAQSLVDKILKRLSKTLNR